MQQHAEQYGAVRRSLTEFVRGLDESQLAAKVPTCPGWTVRDVVAHLAGVASDVATGNMDGAPGDAWTAAQLERRTHASIGEILDEWEDAGAVLEKLLAEAPPQMGMVTVADATSHELDVRGAVGDSGAQDAPHLPELIEGFVKGLGRRVDEAGLPAVRVVADGRELVAGRKSDPGATVERSSFELLRAMTGRRSRDQIAAMFTDGDAGAYLDVFSIFEIRPSPLTE